MLLGGGEVLDSAIDGVAWGTCSWWTVRPVASGSRDLRAVDEKDEAAGRFHKSCICIYKYNTY